MHIGTAVNTSTLQLTSLVGDAGLGKTRILDELLSILEAGKRTIRVYRLSLSDLSGLPLLRHVLRERFGASIVSEASRTDRIDSVRLALS